MIEVQIGDDRNSNVFFRPLGRVLRGTIDINNVREPRARLLINQWPRPIPGVKVVVDGTTAAIVEPLYDAGHAAIRERVEAMGFKLPVQREEFKDISVDTWCFWLRRAVQSDSAKIVVGKFPDIDNAKVTREFITVPQPDPRERRVDQLLAILIASLPAEKSKELAALLVGG